MMIGREAVLSEVSQQAFERSVSVPCSIGKDGPLPWAVGPLPLAEEFSGQVHFVDLGSLTDPHHVAEARRDIP